MPTVLMILLIAGIIVAVVVIGQKRGKKLLAEGKIVKRQGSFWEYSELFTTTATYEQIVDAVKQTDFSDCQATAEYYDAEKTILFKSSHAWNATVTFKGTSEGKNQLDFRFSAYRTRKGIPYRVDTMNIMETAIEKIVLSIDSQTTVESHRMKLTVK